jgi:hypothetical protein
MGNAVAAGGVVGVGIARPTGADVQPGCGSDYMEPLHELSPAGSIGADAVHQLRGGEKLRGDDPLHDGKPNHAAVASRSALQSFGIRTDSYAGANRNDKEMV